MTSYDVIGDIHGHADKLEALLVKMGYTPKGRGYEAPLDRQAVFLGDLIDRGPGQLRVLEIVRSMVDSGDARSIAGNHEFNAVGLVTRNRAYDREYLRPRTLKNLHQAAAFLDAVTLDSAAHNEWVTWFKTLPISLDLGGIRVVHADWNSANVDVVDAALWGAHGNSWSDDFVYGSYVCGSDLMRARKLLTCGLEYELPEGEYVADGKGVQHKEVRIARWRHGATRLKDVALIPHGMEHGFTDIDLDGVIELEAPSGSPVFIGHHWFNGHPLIETPKLACLDWSVTRDDGKLVAYRWDGEKELVNEKLVWV